MQVAVQDTPLALPPAPAFDGNLAKDLARAQKYLRECASQASGPHRAAARQAAQGVKEDFFRRNAAEMYAELTGNLSRQIRVSELVYAGAERYAGLLPTRAEIDAERALRKQIAKEGREIDQRLVVAHVLADPRCGMHLVHAMLRPKREAEERLAEFKRTGRVEIGATTVERKGNVGIVTHGNPQFINAEDDGAMAAMETAVDLALLDDRIQVGVLRGSVLQHP